MPTTGTASAATGVISMALLTAVVVLGVLVNRRGRLPGLPRFAGLSLHRYLSLLAIGFLTVHVLTAVAAPLAGIGLTAAVIPFTSTREPVWMGLGAVSFDLMIALIVTSLLRRHIGRRTWRAVHWLAYLCWPAALAHSIGTGPGLRTGRLFDLAVACVAAVAAAAGWRLAATWRRAPPTRRIPGPAAAPERIPAPVPAETYTKDTKLLRVNPIACSGHGLCAELLPELITLDRWGYPMLADQPVPARLVARARRAVTDCPLLALSLSDAQHGEASHGPSTSAD
jgi:DMSO/TMAO reductase YedYZ heme-binding membrane subunit/ferredoxin